MTLSTSSNFAKPDDAFRAIVEAHRGLSETESADLDAALVLVLANHIGSLVVLQQAFLAARTRDHAPRDRLRDEKDRIQIGRHDLAPVAFREIRERQGSLAQLEVLALRIRQNVGGRSVAETVKPLAALIRFP